MSAPIPRRLLTQTAYVRMPDGEGSYGPEVRVDGVRLDARAGVRSEDWQLQNALAGTLFVDAANSSPAMELPAGALVRMEGESAPAAVARCVACRDERGVHHWEVELS